MDAEVSSPLGQTTSGSLQPADRLASALGPSRASIINEAWGWRQPKFQPDPSWDSMRAQERKRPPKLGGRSKKELLGSVADSWAPVEKDDGSRPYGMFEIEEESPSRSASPTR